MRILFIRPGLCGNRMLDALQPLAIAALFGRTPKHHTCVFQDDALGEEYEGPLPDLVAITVQTFSALRAYALASVYRKQGISVVLGGYHPTMMPEESILYADAIVRGDAEGVWEKLLEDFENGSLKREYISDHTRPLNDVVFDKTIFGDRKYPQIELALVTKGCRFSCDFCAIKLFYKNVRTRPLEQFSSELERVDRQKILFVVDDNLYASPGHFEDLLEVLRRSKLRWACQISIDVARDEKLVQKMARSGCIMVIIGFESLDANTLEQIGKKWNTVSGPYESVVERFHRCGIGVFGTFVFGYDADTVDTIDTAYTFAQKSKLEIANFNPLTPMPGSKLYNRLLAEGRMLYPKWWIEENFKYGTSAFVPKKMTPEAFSKKCFQVRKDFYSWRSIFRRIFFSKTKYSRQQFRGIVTANMISHFEIARKQNKNLGGIGENNSYKAKYWKERS